MDIQHNDLIREHCCGRRIIDIEINDDDSLIVIYLSDGNQFRIAPKITTSGLLFKRTAGKLDYSLPLTSQFNIQDQLDEECL